jgi:anti-anti-sigma regulatory factor
MIPASRTVVIDLSRVVAPDMSDVDALAELQLLARRVGASLVFEHANAELRSLIEFCGLGEVLPARGRSVLEPDRETEQRKQIGVDEEVDRGDAIT